MLTLKAPAKINWFLKVLGPRGDGYHNIESIVQKITLYDTLVFAPSGDLVLKTGLRIPVEQNLAYRAALLLKKEFKTKEGIEIHLDKNIPVAAGLGGGSSDAASTLLGLNKVWSLELSDSDLYRFAERLGSDVPLFLHKSPAYVEGRGEKITGCKAENPVNLLLVTPPIKISAQWAYENLKSAPENNTKMTKKTAESNQIISFIQTAGSGGSYGNGPVRNDLEPAVLRSFPLIADIKEKLIGEGAFFAIMSGSGPTVFGVFESAEKAGNASKKFKDCRTEVVRTITD